MKSLYHYLSGKLPLISVIIGAILISFSGVYVKMADVSPTISGFYRMLFGAIVLFVIVVLKRENVWKNARYLLIAIFCAIFFAGDLLVWHKSILYIGPGLSTIIANFQVFTLALYGVYVLKEKGSPKLFLSMPMAIIGLFLITGLDWNSFDETYKIGILLALATAVSYSFYILTLRKLQAERSPLSPVSNLFIISVFTSIIMAGFAISGGESFAIPDQGSLFALILYGVLSQVIGWTLISYGLPKLKASLAGLLLLLQPSFAFIWDMLFFSRPVDWVSGTGVVITLSAIYLGTMSQAGNLDSKNKKRPVNFRKNHPA